MPALTPDGINQKLNQLYNLSDNDLLTQAASISLDLKAWLRSNFTLTLDQDEYIDDISEMVNRAWGAQFAAIIIARGPIIIGNPPDEPRRTKQVDIDIEGSVRYIPGQAPVISLQGGITWIIP